MSSKKIGLALCALGVIACIGAVKLDSKSSFDDGSFMGQIALFCLGMIMIGGGLAVAIFGD